MMTSNHLTEKCTYCSNSNCLQYFDSESKFIHCKECSVLFREHLNRTKQHIKKTSFQPTIVQKLKNKITHERFWKLISDQYVQYLKNKTDMNFKTAFDIGAQYGTFVKSLNDLGLHTHGIESNEEQIQYSVTKKIESGYFDETYKTDKKFDLISLTEMIYYLPV